MLSKLLLSAKGKICYPTKQIVLTFNLTTLKENSQTVIVSYTYKIYTFYRYNLYVCLYLSQLKYLQNLK